MKTPPFAVILITIISTFLASCSSTNYLKLTVIEPAPVTIPQAIKTIGIIDRSLPSDKNDKLDKLEKILTAEGKNLDKDGAKQAINGLYNELAKNEGFTEVKILENVDLRNPTTGNFPNTIDWKTISSICSKNKVDAIFALSFYDTDTKIDYQAVPVEITGPLNVKIPGIEHHATVTTIIKTGWRIYDPINKQIIDEFPRSETIVTKGVGINPMKAVEAVMGRKEAVLQQSANIGQNYSARILPYSLRVSRRYFVRGTNNFKIAKRRAQIGNWDGAAQLWDKEIENQKSKVAGRACYNMAIINEINGNLEHAFDWAGKAYIDYNNKLARDYANLLKTRIEKSKQLEQ